jgi:phenylacetate-coenzyme A ligase PaaK-like adenylate-forming protein
MNVSYKSVLTDSQSILQVSTANFDQVAIEVFHYQYAQNALYRSYCDALHINAHDVRTIFQIPFLPISFFKTHKVITGNEKDLPSLVFESSGTTGESTSRHYIHDERIYEHSLLQGFKQFYGSPSEYVILALLPSYLERKNASLVYMAKTLMRESAHKDNGFYINEWEQLNTVLSRSEKSKQRTLLLGVTFALLDFAGAYPMPLNNTIVMETGGMKGRRREMTRAEVHMLLKEQWQLENIHSEYGMTELLSQAYSAGEGIFKCTDTMKVLVRDINDPLEVKSIGTGGINIIDLANIYSCSFISTEDIGIVIPDGSFEVLGRMDHSALRGCSLMIV